MTYVEAHTIYCKNVNACFTDSGATHQLSVVFTQRFREKCQLLKVICEVELFKIISIISKLFCNFKMSQYQSKICLKLLMSFFLWHCYWKFWGWDIGIKSAIFQKINSSSVHINCTLEEGWTMKRRNIM